MSKQWTLSHKPRFGAMSPIVMQDRKAIAWLVKHRDLEGMSRDARLIINAPKTYQTLIKLWSAVENGTIDDEFMTLRKAVREVM